MTIPEFQKWLAEAKKGAKLTYHIGFLAYDREYAAAAQKPSIKLMAEILRAFERGLVHLYQRRIGHMQFEYIAERRMR